MKKLISLKHQLSKHLILLLCCTLPHLVWAQSVRYYDSTAWEVVKAECDGHMFTKTEVLPSVKGGEKVLADSLINYFTSQNTPIKGKATYGFLVTKAGAVVGIKKLAGALSDETIFKEALITYSAMWMPASQNKHLVCAVVLLEIEAKKEKILLKITQ